MTISENDIRAELSYAYLHAVASHGGFSCQQMCRTADGLCIDAEVLGRETFATDSKIDDITLQIQLKATSQPCVLKNGKYSFPLELAHYNKLRTTRTLHTKLLVVLFLPEKQSEWLSHSEDYLLTRRCAYWVSLRGATKSQNRTSETVYVPKAQVFSSDSLREIMTRVSRREEVLYAG